jgi:ABC-type multidrug transport system ATPase subunit
MYCIEIKNLSHKFKSNQVVLNSVNLQVPIGSIYGFLGPNGAGKTTTLRLMLGLLKKQEGEIIVFNQTFENNRISILQKIGSLIESPSVYAHLTANENLLVWQKIYQSDQQGIEDVLQMVGLTNTGNKKAGDFSLGMKQRLGLAVALLNNPTLLILDEPTNGLDPNGIVEMRELLTDLNKKHGITILISSHLLAEIEKLVTHVGVINKGSILFEGTLEELMDKQAKNSIVYIKTNNNLKALTLLSNKLIAENQLEQLKISVATKSEIAALIRLFIQNDIDVYEITTGNSDLESAFMNLLSQ